MFVDDLDLSPNQFQNARHDTPVLGGNSLELEGVVTRVDHDGRIRGGQDGDGIDGDQLDRFDPHVGGASPHEPVDADRVARGPNVLELRAVVLLGKTGPGVEALLVSQRIVVRVVVVQEGPYPVFGQQRRGAAAEVVFRFGGAVYDRTRASVVAEKLARRSIVMVVFVKVVVIVVVVVVEFAALCDDAVIATANLAHCRIRYRSVENRPLPMGWARGLTA